MDYDKICDGIRELIIKEVKNSLKETELLLSYRPHCMDRVSTQFLTEDCEHDAEIDIVPRCIDLRKVVMDFLDERDGCFSCEDDSQVLKEWAKEFEMYAKKFRKQAEILDAQIEAKTK